MTPISEVAMVTLWGGPHDGLAITVSVDDRPAVVNIKGPQGATTYRWTNGSNRYEVVRGADQS